jgi:hypothetical protein
MPLKPRQKALTKLATNKMKMKSHQKQQKQIQKLLQKPVIQHLIMLLLLKQKALLGIPPHLLRSKFDLLMKTVSKSEKN